MKKKTPNVPKVRKKWVINPHIRVKKSIKLYTRAKAKRELTKRVEDEEYT